MESPPSSGLCSQCLPSTIGTMQQLYRVPYTIIMGGPSHWQRTWSQWQPIHANISVVCAVQCKLIWEPPHPLDWTWGQWEAYPCEQVIGSPVPTLKTQWRQLISFIFKFSSTEVYTLGLATPRHTQHPKKFNKLYVPSFLKNPSILYVSLDHSLLRGLICWTSNKGREKPMPLTYARDGKCQHDCLHRHRKLAK